MVSEFKDKIKFLKIIWIVFLATRFQFVFFLYSGMIAPGDSGDPTIGIGLIAFSCLLALGGLWLTRKAHDLDWLKNNKWLQSSKQIEAHEGNYFTLVIIGLALGEIPAGMSIVAIIFSAPMELAYTAIGFSFLIGLFQRPKL